MIYDRIISKTESLAANQEGRHTPVIAAHKRLRQEECSEFDISRSCVPSYKSARGV